MWSIMDTGQCITSICTYGYCSKPQIDDRSTKLLSKTGLGLGYTYMRSVGYVSKRVHWIIDESPASFRGARVRVDMRHFARRDPLCVLFEAHS